MKLFALLPSSFGSAIALLALPCVLVAASSATGGYLFQEDFESSNAGDPQPASLGRSATPGSIIEVVSSPVRSGHHALRLKVEYRDSKTYRAEVVVSQKGVPGGLKFAYDTEYWVGFSEYLKDWAPDSKPEMVHQIHRPESDPMVNPECLKGAGNNLVQLDVPAGGTHLKVLISKDQGPCPTNGASPNTSVWTGSTGSNEWVDWVIHFKASLTPTGFCEIWRNGVRVHSEFGIVNAQDTFRGCCSPIPENKKFYYPKWGIYKSSWRDGVGNVAARELFLDELRIWQGANGFAAVAPGARPAPTLPPTTTKIVPGPLFTDLAVLQRDKPVPVWGFAQAGEEIVVRHRGATARATADRDGHWMATLPAFAASEVGADLTITGRETVTLRDVVVGDVWLCSGQSNMAWSVARAANAEQEIAAARFPALRHIRIQGEPAERPQHAAKSGGWQPTTPETAGAFSAVAYYFGRHLHRELGVPIGLVNSSWSGTRVEAWMSRETLARDPAFAVVAERWQTALEEYPAAKRAFDAAEAAYIAGEATAKAAGVPALAEFRRTHTRAERPLGPGSLHTPSGLFNGIIHPLLPFALRGAIWYQGEGNAARHSEYARLFTAMIQSWRADFGQGEFPFYWVQLANRHHPVPLWSELRAAQAEALALPNTGQAITIDIGERDQTHARNKQDVGRRLALIALAKTYGRDAEYSGPVFAGAERDGAVMRVQFSHAEAGLVARGGSVESLEIAGADGRFVTATGRIDGTTLVVSAAEVRQPVSVRYAWAEDPKANLYNHAGLPAAPFRSAKP